MSRDADKPEIEAGDSPVEEQAASPPQFTLRSLFLLMTMLAAAMGLALWLGTGTLPHSLGMIVSLANVTGHLKRAQTKRARPKWFALAWLLFLASLFLPAAKGCNNEPVYGWEAATIAMSAEFGVVTEIATRENSGDLFEDVCGFFYLTLLNLGNLCMLFSPLLLRRLNRDKGRWYGNVFCFCAFTVWLVSWQGDEMLSGYVVWCVSFAALFIAYRLSWRMFLGLILYSAACGVCAWLLA